ncbi:MAG TPA: DUF5696 domain-containing protein [archaeon]|nr:DUF5696 domain-containing protein [archaeon]
MPEKTTGGNRCNLLIIFLLLFFVRPADAAEDFKIETKELEATLDPATMSVDVKHLPAGIIWRMSREGNREFVYESNGEIHEVSLADSRQKKVTRLGRSSLLVTLADYRLEILIWLDEQAGDLIFKFIPLEEDHLFKIKGLIYPRPFEVPVRPDCYSFFGYSQGCLIPGNWDQKEDINNPIQFDDDKRFKLFGELMGRPANWWDSQEWDQAGLVYPLRMACFGAVQPGSGFLAAVDDNCRMDTDIHVKHTPGKPTDYMIYWRPTMGVFGYPRVISYHFEKNAGYVSLVKHYRKYYERLGYLKTLAGKNRENPKVEMLKGAVNLRARISRKDHRTFNFEVYNTFHDVGEQIEEFRNRVGAERASLSFTGWQRYGHDQEYPDIMPPMMYAGGPEGLDSLARKVKKMGYIFGLATDNYCDITLDSPSFREEVTLKDSQGSYFRRSTWGAGVNSLICPRWAIRFLRRNFEVGRTDYPGVRGLLDTAPPDHYLLGNYVCNWECYDPRHPLTRNENRQALAEIFQYFKEKGILLTIEHHNDWVVPWIVSARTRAAHDVVYGRDEAGRIRGIPIPLWQLAFHDCTYVSGDNYLYALLWGGQASMGLPVPEDQARIDDVLLLAKLHRAIGWDEMTNHRFLSDDYIVQETTFSSGAKVWADMANKKFRITGVPGITEEVREAR